MPQLERATQLLDLLGSEPGRLWTVAQLAAASGIGPSGCTRTLQALRSMDWVEQPDSRGPYRLGPRAYALTASGPYRQELLDLVVQPMRALARSFDGLGVVVAELKPHGQQVIWECGAFRRPDIGLGWIEQTPWHGTCCRVLVANLPAPQRRRWIDRNGLPNPTQWPGLADRTDLLSALADIRRAGVATAHIRPYAQVSAAVHLHLGAEHVAIGVYGPDSIDEQSLAQALRDCAECRIKTLQTTTR